MNFDLARFQPTIAKGFVFFPFICTTTKMDQRMGYEIRRDLWGGRPCFVGCVQRRALD